MFFLVLRNVRHDNTNSRYAVHYYIYRDIVRCVTCIA